VEWKHLAGISALCNTLGISESDYRLARSQIKRVYIQTIKRDIKSGKSRDICYPRPGSMLQAVQHLLKDNILAKLPILSEIRGYLLESHNITTASDVCGHAYVGKVDISKFHPSISEACVSAVLSEHGLSPSFAREIARMVTYEGRVVQGAATSNHVANLVMDSLLRRDVKAFADRCGVGFRNFGDDVAFFGPDAAAVRACVKRAKKAITNLGFQSNDKCRDSEHRGSGRKFVGCATGRELPDYPRIQYRALRKELRALVQSERLRCGPKPLTSKEQLNSLKHRIVYVKRLNHTKARRLMDIFYRLCAARREHHVGVLNMPMLEQG